MAFFEKQCIRDCFVRLFFAELFKSKIPKAAPKNNLLPSKGKNLRSEVSWLPTSSSVLANSSEALSTLAVYHEINDIAPPVARQNVRRQRAKSMFGSPDQPNDLNTKKYSKDDIPELQTKYNIPNFGLKSSRDRSLGPKPQQPLLHWQKLSEEFKMKLAKKV